VISDKHPVNVGRSYDPRKPEGGLRVLVDRIWPRGLSKEAADLDEWCKGSPVHRVAHVVQP
jgi:uncharacterized protein YeaO (DUF488 family)